MIRFVTIRITYFIPKDIKLDKKWYNTSLGFTVNKMIEIEDN